MEAKPQRALTREEVDKYVDIEGIKCPFKDCRSRDIEVYGEFDMDQDVSQIWQNVKCNGCGRTWTDEYHLDRAHAHDESNKG